MIEYREVSSGYSSKAVLNRFSLRCEDGRLTALIGVNGSGKSTVLKSALGLAELRSGSILLDGADIFSVGRRERAKRVSYLPQTRSTPDMSARQLVLHGRFPHMGYPRVYRTEDYRAADEALARMNLSALADTPLSQMSGGQRQRVYLAMSLCQGADNVLLDEPNVYLDLTHQYELMESLRTLATEGKCVLCVLHDIPMALTYADDIALMDDGRGVAYGTPEELVSSKIIESVFSVRVHCVEDGGKTRYFCSAKESD